MYFILWHKHMNTLADNYIGLHVLSAVTLKDMHVCMQFVSLCNLQNALHYLARLGLGLG